MTHHYMRWSNPLLIIVFLSRFLCQAISSRVQQAEQEARCREMPCKDGGECLFGGGFCSLGKLLLFSFPPQGIVDDEFACGMMESPGWEGLNWSFCSNSLLVQEVIHLQYPRQMGIFQSPPGCGRTKMQFDRLTISWAGKLLTRSSSLF